MIRPAFATILTVAFAAAPVAVAQAMPVTYRVDTKDPVVFITIDDGMRDGYDNALPILQRHGFVATFAVVVGRVDRRRRPRAPRPAARR